VGGEEGGGGVSGWVLFALGASRPFGALEGKREQALNGDCFRWLSSVKQRREEVQHENGQLVVLNVVPV
jgi:hypothetical protein